MPTFAEIKGHTPTNIRKPLELAIFLKPWVAGDEEISEVWDGTGLVVPPEYRPVGMTTKDDGASWSRDQETSDVTAHGYSEPARRDILSDVSGLSFTMIESNRQAMEIYHGRDLAGVTVDEHGGFMFDRASRPATRYFRTLAIGKDGDGPDAVYMARWLPRTSVTGTAEQSWSEGEEIRYPATLTAYLDAEFGTAFRELWGGPGLDAEAMGFGTTTSTAP